jgi:beta-lactamase regulating signal transducer with metallopeptidase domain
VTFDLRLAVVALSTFALAGAAGSVMTVGLVTRRQDDCPAAYARALFRRRMLPAALATAAMAQGILSFVVFEPRSVQETVGVVLTTLAALGVALYVLALARWARVTRATNRVLGSWMRTADALTLPGVTIPTFAIDVAFPVVAVVGIIRPRLVVARQVIARCSAEELRAILAHERRHIENRDNIRRAVMACLPDPLSMTRLGASLTERWHEAAEQAADDAASEGSPTGRYDLAAALLNVARLVPAGQPVMHLPASALYRGEDLERRVRRLLDGPAPSPLPRASRFERLAVGATLVVASGLALHAMHELIEAAVTYLP